MKLVLASLAALVISTPALAQHNHQRHHQHHRHGSWVGPAIIGAIGTAIIIDQYGRQRQVTVDNTPPVVISSTPPVVIHNPPVVIHNPPVVVHNPVVTCTDWREVQDDYGRIYRERFCRSN
jgi:hypothetical protein